MHDSGSSPNNVIGSGPYVHEPTFCHAILFLKWSPHDPCSCVLLVGSQQSHLVPIGSNQSPEEFEFITSLYFALLRLQLLLGDQKLERKHKQILEQYRARAEHYVCACLNKSNGSNVSRTPGGLLYVRQWNNMQYVSGAAFLLSVYSDYLTEAGRDVNCPEGPVGPRDLLDLVRFQTDYILGSNPMGMSYLVGFGSKWPERVHHRSASIVSYKESKGFIGCTQGYDDWYGRRDPNPNVLVGAIVGGPDGRDNFRDVRGNYMQTEACTYNTAPMVGVFARLNKMELGRASS